MFNKVLTTIALLVFAYVAFHVAITYDVVAIEYGIHLKWTLGFLVGILFENVMRYVEK